MPMAKSMGQERFTALWSYAWDLMAEGLDESLGRIADLGLKGISLAVSYHSGMLLLPHNPRQKVRFLEDGAVYFRPQPERFRGLALQPRVTALAEQIDPVGEICRAASRHGLEVVAWTVCCHNSYQGEHHPDLAEHNAFGDPYPFALCPSQPEVQAYLEALLKALNSYPLRALQLESACYMGFHHGHHHEKIQVNLGPLSSYLMGLCFCSACRQRALAAGLDFEALRLAVQSYLARAFEGEVNEPSSASRAVVVAELPLLEPYLAMQDRVHTNMIARLAQSSTIPISLLDPVPHFQEIAFQIGEVTACAYRLAPDEVTRDVRVARAEVGPATRLAVGLEISPRFTPTAENLAAKVQAAWEAGGDGLYLYNYGLVPLRSLRWLGEALKEV
jgi:hypothetical protein